MTEAVPGPQDTGQNVDPREAAAARAAYEYDRDERMTYWERGEWSDLSVAHRNGYLAAARRHLRAADSVDGRDAEIARLREQLSGAVKSYDELQSLSGRCKAERDCLRAKLQAVEALCDKTEANCPGDQRMNATVEWFIGAARAALATGDDSE